MDTIQETAGDDAGPLAGGEDPSHQALQHVLVLVVVAGEGLQLTLQADLHRQGHLGVLQANAVSCIQSHKTILFNLYTADFT